ncbi:MAG: DUF2867 domain-containing protein [Hyphomicrobiaceae bacterium]|nr:DUF2867 domain-containing protein [Hyphomicrobiaceae bacterium]
MLQPSPVAPPADLGDILPGADFADAFALDAKEADLDALGAARRALEPMPPWIAGLLRMRDRIVRPLGLETVADLARTPGARCGIFPILSATPQRVVLGLDDRHLDFRIVIDTSACAPGGTHVTVTTLVKRHNLLGRAYLASIMPFHKLIVPSLLARVA